MDFNELLNDSIDELKKDIKLKDTKKEVTKIYGATTTYKKAEDFTFCELCFKDINKGSDYFNIEHRDKTNTKVCLKCARKKSLVNSCIANKILNKKE